MTQVFVMVIKFFVNVAIFLIVALAIVLLPFVIMCIFQFIRYYRKGYRIPKKKALSTYHKRPILKRLFWDFPEQFVKDRLDTSADAFPYHGLIMICGEQGSGKTCCMVHMLQSLKKMYPMVHISSNIALDFQDSEITSPDDIILKNNGEYGCIKVLDEIQNWFNSCESGSFPPEMLSEISQQRKQHSLFIGTSQLFHRISKPIREQTHYLLMPMTIAGCMTIVRVYKPKLDDDGNVEKMRRLKTYMFVHNDEIRNAYDTFEKVKRLSVKGWKPRAEQLPTEEKPPVFNISTEDNKKKGAKK